MIMKRIFGVIETYSWEGEILIFNFEPRRCDDDGFSANFPHVPVSIPPNCLLLARSVNAKAR